MTRGGDFAPLSRGPPPVLCQSEGRTPQPMIGNAMLLRFPESLMTSFLRAKEIRKRPLPEADSPYLTGSDARVGGGVTMIEALPSPVY